MTGLKVERFFRRLLPAIAITGLALGIAAWIYSLQTLANWVWAAATLPVVLGLGASMTRDLLAGRLGVDAVAFVSMSAALLLNENLAGVVIAVMYSGGNLLEDFAVARAEHDLRSLIDRAPRIAHRRSDSRIEDVEIAMVAIGDQLQVRAGEVVPVAAAHDTPRESDPATGSKTERSVIDRSAIEEKRYGFEECTSRLPHLAVLRHTGCPDRPYIG